MYFTETKDLSKELASVAFYHSDFRNIIIHYFTIPVLLLGTLMLPLQFVFGSPVGHLITLIYFLKYFYWDPFVAVIWVLMLTLLIPVSQMILENTASPDVVVILFFFGSLFFTVFFSFIIGSYIFEGKNPSRNIYRELVLYPFYFVILALFSKGYKRELYEQVKKETENFYLPWLTRNYPETNKKLYPNDVLSINNLTMYNWAKNIEINPEYRFFPKSLKEVKDIIKLAKQKCKKVCMIGEGHSWSPMASTKDYLIDVRMLRKISVDKEKNLVTIQPGVSIAELDAELRKHDLCVPTNVVLTSVRYGGVISTGCHGAGWNNRPLSDLVISVVLITSDGEEKKINENQMDLLNAVRVSLGTMGFVYEMTLQVLPMYNLRMIDRRVKMNDVMSNPENLKNIMTSEHEMCEMFWFPFSDSMWMKTWDKTDEPSTLSYIKQTKIDVIQFFETYIGIIWYKFLTRFSTQTERVVPIITRTVGRYSNIVGPVPDLVHYRKFIEDGVCYNTEFAIKADKDWKNVCEMWNKVVKLINEYKKINKFPVNLCIEMRICKNSKAWLSPCIGEEGDFFAYIEVISYINTPGWNEAARDIAEEMMDLGGKPHWAKMYQVVDKEKMNPHIRLSWGSFQL